MVQQIFPDAVPFIGQTDDVTEMPVVIEWLVADVIIARIRKIPDALKDDLI